MRHQFKRLLYIVVLTIAATTIVVGTLSLLAQGQSGDAPGHSVRGYEMVVSESCPIPSLGLGTCTVECPNGKVPTGGGFEIDWQPPTAPLFAGFRAVVNRPTSTGWKATIASNTSNEPLFNVYAICVSAR